MSTLSVNDKKPGFFEKTGFLLFVLLTAMPAEAAVTPAQRRELSVANREIRQAGLLLRQKKVDQAAKLFNQAEGRVNKVVKNAGLNDKVPAIAALKKQIATGRAYIEKLKGATPSGGSGESGSVSFATDVAPILADRCLGCHAGEDTKAKLRLDTFAGMKKGGQNGSLLVIGNPGRSLIMRRLTASGARRMPKSGKPLTREQIRTIATWIDEGAKFDGEDESASLTELVKSQDGKPQGSVPVKIPRPDGDETVSFKEDIAPFMANICLRCHGGNNPRSGFSLETFEKLMIGGDSGRVLVPGSLKESRLWHLVGEQDPFKMPPGNALITKTNWRDLKTWIQEGAKYDGGDPKKPLRELVPTEAEKRAAKLANMSPQEFVAFRKQRSRELWDRTVSKESPTLVETDEFVMVGNVSQERLEQLGGWAEEQAQSLRKLFGTDAERLWKGKLAVFVFKDRFGYEEFNFSIHDRSTPQKMIGHSVVAPTFEDAYVAVQDIGDDVSSASPGMRINLIDHVTGAFLQRSGTELPDWLVRGTGLALAGRSDSSNVYIKTLSQRVPELLQSVRKPEDIFADGTFPPSGVAAVGYTLVKYMLDAGGEAKFRRLIAGLQQGRDLAAVMNAVYGASPKQIAEGYWNRVAKSR